MSLIKVVKNLADREDPNRTEIKEAIANTVDHVTTGKLQVLELVQTLDPVLTNRNYEVRQKGVELLCDIIVSFEKHLLIAKEIEVLSEFLYLRFLDHRSMQKSVLTCLSFFVDCKNKPSMFNAKLIDFLKTKVNVQSLTPEDRFTVYVVLKKITHQRQLVSSKIDGGFVYSIVHLIEGEGDPKNLLLCFEIVSFILKNFQDLEPFVDDLFEWLSSYYPVDYTPNEKERFESNITRANIVDALYDCFFATPLNAENLQTLLLEKLDSNLITTKLESLDCFIKCHEVFPLDSIKNFTSSLWTAIRVECLKKKDTVDHKLLSKCHEALGSLSKKLAEDDDMHSNFICDLYEELSIAFRKPEMDLFEPAAALLASACLPRLRSYEYILEKILPISINALRAGEMRPIPALQYFLEHLRENHSIKNLHSGLMVHLENLATHICDESTQSQSLGILRVMFLLRLPFNDDILTKVVRGLREAVDRYNDDTEECLALICANYKKMDIITDNLQICCDLIGLLRVADRLQPDADWDRNNKYSIYLRIIILLLDSSRCDELNSIDAQELDNFLISLRRIAVEAQVGPRVLENTGKIHAILLNKSNDDCLTKLIMSIVNSDYCQKLTPNDSVEQSYVKHIYIPLLSWVLKSLVVRNSQFATAFMNLILNVIVSQQVDRKVSMMGVEVFDFVSRDDMRLFAVERDYRVFVLFRQKFYTVSRNEIMTRYSKEEDESKRGLLIGCLSVQLPTLVHQVYKKDFDWLMRHHLKVLHSFRTSAMSLGYKFGEDLLKTVFRGIDTLIRGDQYGSSSFLGTLVDASLYCAVEGKTWTIRKLGLECLRNLTHVMKEQELLILRSRVVDQLKKCLSDQKRIVRQAAADARLKWVLVGQPIGGG